ncbi:MAG: hypothetical protein ACI905_000787 [Roseivirga sp.]
MKLMDGFPGNLTIGEESFCLDNAERFINYPFFNEHQYELSEKGSRSKDSILFQWVKRRFS